MPNTIIPNDQGSDQNNASGLDRWEASQSEGEDKRPKAEPKPAHSTERKLLYQAPPGFGESTPGTRQRNQTRST